MPRVTKRTENVNEVDMIDDSPEVEVSTAEQEVVEPPVPIAPTVQITREIASVVIEVPLCRNPPPRGYTTPPHINLQLTKGRSKEGRHTLHSLHWGLKEIGATLANGRPVRDRNDVLIWLLDQINEANAPVNA